MSDEDEYRFHPEDFDDDGELIEDDADAFRLAPLVIVGSLGAGIVLFLVDPVVDPIGVFGIDVEPRSLSAVVFAVGLLAGGSLYARHGQRLLGAIHVAGAFGWALLALGTALSNDVLLVGGGVLLVLGAVLLVLLTWRSD